MSSCGVMGWTLMSRILPFSLLIHLQSKSNMWVSIQHGSECLVNTFPHDVHTCAVEVLRDLVTTVNSKASSKESRASVDRKDVQSREVA